MPFSDTVAAARSAEDHNRPTLSAIASPRDLTNSLEVHIGDVRIETIHGPAFEFGRDGRVLHGTRGLKQEDHFVFVVIGWSRPSRDAWIETPIIGNFPSN